MKILLFGDAHFSKCSSLLNKSGTKYTARLENQIQTFNWIKEQALERNCDMVIGLGDLFNASQLNDMEITAAKDLPFADLPTYLLVGNHESSLQNLNFSSTKLLENTNCKVISEPLSFYIGSTELCLLPYITERDRKALVEYFPERDTAKKRVILSHNDIKGINYGPVVSSSGFSLTEIETACDLFINAHIHNGQQISSKIYNIGNLTGQNFSEDAFKYSHNIIILDTDNLQLDFIENPYAYHFYKIQIDSEGDLCVFNQLKQRAVVSIKCESTLVELVKQKLTELDGHVLESRVIPVKKIEESTISTPNWDLTVDHLARFVDCCKNHIENSSLLEEELNQICNNNII